LHRPSTWPQQQQQQQQQQLEEEQQQPRRRQRRRTEAGDDDGGRSRRHQPDASAADKHEQQQQPWWWWRVPEEAGVTLARQVAAAAEALRQHQQQQQQQRPARAQGRGGARRQQKQQPPHQPPSRPSKEAVEIKRIAQRALAEDGAVESAAALLAEGLRRFPADRALALLLASCASRAGDHAAARAALAPRLASDGTSMRLLTGASAAARRAGDAGAARGMARRAVAVAEGRWQHQQQHQQRQQQQPPWAAQRRARDLSVALLELAMVEAAMAVAAATAPGTAGPAAAADAPSLLRRSRAPLPLFGSSSSSSSSVDSLDLADDEEPGEGDFAGGVRASDPFDRDLEEEEEEEEQHHDQQRAAMAGHADAARALFEQAARADPSHAPRALTAWAALERDLGRPPAARRLLRAALERDPSHAPALHSLAALEAREGDWQAARGLAARALAGGAAAGGDDGGAADTGHVPSRAMLARATAAARAAGMESQDEEEEQGEAAAAAAAAEQDPWLSRARAEAARRRQDISRARSLLGPLAEQALVAAAAAQQQPQPASRGGRRRSTAAVATTPAGPSTLVTPHVRALVSSAVTEARAGNAPRAAELFAAARRLAPRSPVVLLAHAAFLSRQGAAAAAAEAAAAPGRDPQAAAAAAAAEAEAALALAAEVDPAHPRLCYTRALQAQARGDLPAARAWLCLGARGPGAVPLGAAADANGNGDGSNPPASSLPAALAAASAALARLSPPLAEDDDGNPTTTTSTPCPDARGALLCYELWAGLEAFCGGAAAARALVAEALRSPRTGPPTPRFLREAALLEKRAGRLDAAMALLEAAARRDPADYKTWLAGAVLERRRRREGRAARWFERGVAVAPGNPHLWYAYATMVARAAAARRGDLREEEEEEEERQQQQAPEAYAVALPPPPTTPTPTDPSRWDAQAARRLFERATSACPRNAPLWMEWALFEWALAAPGARGEPRRAAARELFARGAAVPASHRHPPLLDAWARREFEAGDAERAAELQRQYERALEAGGGGGGGGGGGKAIGGF
jgi:hypothetical protein